MDRELFEARNRLATRVNLTLLVVGTAGGFGLLRVLSTRPLATDLVLLPLVFIAWHLVMERLVSRWVTARIVGEEAPRS